MPSDATRDVERELLTHYDVVIGMDEVGRGAIAGPVVVGACLVTGDEAPQPAGLRDSKQLSEKRRVALEPLVCRWATSVGVGFASNDEVDAHGIIVGLRLAGMRALQQLDIPNGARVIVLLDGTHNWLTRSDDLFSPIDDAPYPDIEVPNVVTRVKADASCSVVAGASVVAKVRRDEWMKTLEDPGYDWASNKGYSSAKHIDALRRLGVSPLHRRSWNLPGTGHAECA